MPHHRIPSDLQVKDGSNFPSTFKAEYVPNLGYMRGWGTAVPTDGDTDWGTGALFQHTDGSGGDDLIYQNNGDKDSCAFIEITSVAGADFGATGLKADVIAESTSATGVTADSVLLKDGSIVCADGGSIDVDTINEATAANGVAIDGVTIKDSDIVITDAGSLITATGLMGALQEAFQHIQTAQACVPIPFGAFTLEDGTTLAKYSAGGGTPGFQQISNKEVVLAWDGNANPAAVSCTIPMPLDLNGGADVVVHFLAAMAGATDTPVIVFEAYFGKGDTDCAGTDPEVTGGTTLTEYTMTIDSGDVPAPPSALTLVIDPTDGEMGTDELHIYGVWLEYTRATLTS